MATRRDYTAEGVEAAHSVLIELVHLLGEYKDDIVLIGGWVPEVSLPHQRAAHVGSRGILGTYYIAPVKRSFFLHDFQ